MERSFGKLLPASLAALVLASFAMGPYAEPPRLGAAVGCSRGRRRWGRSRCRRRWRRRQAKSKVNNSRADARTNNVRSTSVNNVNVDRNVNVNVEGDGGCCGGWDNDYHPVATAAAISAGVAVTSAIVGSLVRSVPPSCVPVNYGGMVYQQCGSTWYQPQGSQYVVVNPPY